jgi:hypothetical protein
MANEKITKKAKYLINGRIRASFRKMENRLSCYMNRGEMITKEDAEKRIKKILENNPNK